MHGMMRIKITEQVLTDNPWMEQSWLGSYVWVPYNLDLGTGNVESKAAADDQEQTSGDGYVGTRPPDGRP